MFVKASGGGNEQNTMVTESNYWKRHAVSRATQGINTASFTGDGTPSKSGYSFKGMFEIVSASVSL